MGWFLVIVRLIKKKKIYNFSLPNKVAGNYWITDNDYLGNFKYSWWLGDDEVRDDYNLHRRLTLNTNAKRRLLWER